MTDRWEEMRRAFEETKRIARERPMPVILMAQQPEPLRRAAPPKTPQLIIVDGLGLLR